MCGGSSEQETTTPLACVLFQVCEGLQHGDPPHDGLRLDALVLRVSCTAVVFKVTACIDEVCIQNGRV